MGVWAGLCGEAGGVGVWVAGGRGVGVGGAVWRGGRCGCVGGGRGAGGGVVGRVWAVGVWAGEELLGGGVGGCGESGARARWSGVPGLWLAPASVLERRAAHLRRSSKGRLEALVSYDTGCSRPSARWAFRSAVRPNGRFDAAVRRLDAAVRVAGTPGPATRRGRHGPGCRARRRSGLALRVWSMGVNSRCESSEGQRPRRAWCQIVPAAQESVPMITSKAM